jgi:cob(I)alamin adenosyltransferase
MVPGVEGGPVRVYTRAGDDGTTGLFLGGRVSKADALMSACGDIDEAVAVLGIARASCPDADIASEVFGRQRELFVVAADLAANPAHRDRLEPGVSVVTADMVTGVERSIDAHVERRPLRPVFLVPGSTPTSAHLDHARTVVRRAERGVVGLRESGAVVSDDCLRYLNRLSDLLFVLARDAAGEPEPTSHD